MTDEKGVCVCVRVCVSTTSIEASRASEHSLARTDRVHFSTSTNLSIDEFMQLYVNNDNERVCNRMLIYSAGAVLFS